MERKESAPTRKAISATATTEVIFKASIVRKELSGMNTHAHIMNAESLIKILETLYTKATEQMRARERSFNVEEL